MAVNSIKEDILILESPDNINNDPERLNTIINKIDLVLNQVVEQIKNYEEEDLYVG